MTSRYQLDRSVTAKRSSDCRAEAARQRRALFVLGCASAHGPLSGPRVGARNKGIQDVLKSFRVF